MCSIQVKNLGYYISFVVCPCYQGNNIEFIISQ